MKRASLFSVIPSLDIPHFMDLELFLLAGWISRILIRAVADSVKLRLYVDFKEWKIKVGRPSQSSNSFIHKASRAFGGKNQVPNTHVRHFLFGMILMPVAFVALYWRFWYGPVLAGVVMALVFSEIKELVLMNWGQ
jgi:hypothetical protein